MPAQSRIIDILPLLPIPLLDNLLHLPDQAPTSLADGLTRLLEPILSLAPKVRLDPRRGDQLRRAGRNVVTRDDELLGGIPPADDPIGGLDEGVCGGGDGFGGADETFGPAVVFLVKGRARGGAAAFLDDFLLGGGGGFDELGDGVGDGDGGFEDDVVDLEFVGRVSVARFLHELVEALGGCVDGVGGIG